MGTLILRRLIQSIVVIFIVTIISFLLLQLLPGDPARAMLGLTATQQDIDALRHQLWLDKPVLVQYAHWLSSIVHGNIGFSVFQRVRVTTLIARALPITLYLAAIALVTSLVFAILAGTISAVKRGSLLDQTIVVLANSGISVPVFWLGILGIYLFGLKLGWLPIFGYTSPFVNFWQSTRQLIMPVLCMGLGTLAMLTRQTRSSLLEVIRQDYIRTARAKGLSKRVVIGKHALRNGLIPIVTLIGLNLPILFGGSVLVETVFNIPGIGRLLVQAVFQKDVVVVQAIVFIIAVVVSVTNTLVDIAYGWLDPRIHYR